MLLSILPFVSLKPRFLATLARSASFTRPVPIYSSAFAMNFSIVISLSRVNGNRFSIDVIASDAEPLLVLPLDLIYVMSLASTQYLNVAPSSLKPSLESVAGTS